MSDTKDPKVSGPRTPYRPKVNPTASISLTQLGKDILQATADRLGQSKSNIVEHLLRTRASDIHPVEFEGIETDEAEPAHAGTSAQ